MEGGPPVSRFCTSFIVVFVCVMSLLNISHAAPITVVYSTATNDGFMDAPNDMGVPKARRDAFEYAVAILESVLGGPMPFTVEASFGPTVNSTAIAEAHPSRWFDDKHNTELVGVPGNLAETVYPAALATEITRIDLTPISQSHHININLYCERSKQQRG